jgi:hypothetical protein
MDAVAKTRGLIRIDLPIDLIDPNPANPNKMNSRQFDLLVDNLQRVGITDPILVRPIQIKKFLKAAGEAPALGPAKFFEKLREIKCRFSTVGGHHRVEAAKYLGFEAAPCTVVTDEAFDEMEEDAQMLRHNAIRGQLDPDAFVSLYAKYAGKYGDADIQELFGFSDEAEFQRLIKATAKSLPKELQAKFKEAAKEVKTVDGLARLLNTLFAKYGDTLPYNFMVFDYNNQQSVWLQCDKKTLDAFAVIGDLCIDSKRTVDDIVGRILQSIAKGELKELVDKCIAGSPEVVLPPGLQQIPTKQNIEAVAALED